MRAFIFCIFAIAMLLSLAWASRAEGFTCPVTKSVPITFDPVGTFAHNRANLVGE